MLRSHVLNRKRRVRATLLIAVLSLATAALLATPAAADAPIYQNPGNVTISASATTGLVNGQVITYSVNTTGANKLIGSVTAHLCLDGSSSYNTTTFGYDSGGNRCVYQPGITAQTGFAGADFEKTAGPYSGSETTTGSLTFKVGTGNLTWGNNAGEGPFNATADATHKLDLVVQVNLVGGSVSQTYIIQPLTFAGQPGAPTGVAATAGDSTAHVTWAAPANTGNGTINSYVVTATRTGGLADASSPRTLTVGNVLAGDIPLQNFSTYSITVHDTIAELPGSPSAESSPPVTGISPLPPAPTNVSGIGANGQVTVSWTAPASPQVVTEYEVTAHDTTNTLADVVHLTGNSSTSYVFTGLTNGTPYAFIVRASYAASVGGGAPFGPYSNGSSGITPTGFEIDQLINVTRPTGALVLTQACDPNTPNPYPQDPTTGLTPAANTLYPTSSVVAGTPGALGSCSVPLGAAQLITGPNGNSIQPQQPTPAQSGTPGYPLVYEGQFFKADGAIHQVTVVNTRETQEPWTVNGKLASNFVSGTSTLSGTSLGWQPALTDKTPDFQTPGQPVYHNDAARGPDVLPANTPSGVGLQSSQVLAQAAAHGLGEAHLDALLHILIPVTTPHGTYTALLQITAI